MGAQSPWRGLGCGAIDTHLRRLRSFLVVADELHFSRAAARLFVAQQALSRQIRDLERELGVQLFERTTRAVRLTAAGAVLQEGARAALETYDAAVLAAQRTQHSLTGTLRVGHIPGAALELTAFILAEFARRFPDVVVETQEFRSDDPSAGLRSSESDVAFIRLPQSTEGIETSRLFDDPVVAVVSTSNRFASRSAISARELVREPMTLSRASDELYRAYWSLAAVRGDSSGPIVPIGSVTEEAQMVAHGVAVAVTSAAATRYLPLPGVRFLEITDWPASVVTVAWCAGQRSPIVSRFVEVACAVRDRETDLVARLERGSGPIDAGEGS